MPAFAGIFLYPKSIESLDNARELLLTRFRS